MINKRHIISLTISLIIVLGINSLIITQLKDIKYIDAQGVVLGNFRQYETITLPADQPFTIKQTIVSTENALAKITLTSKYTTQTKIQFLLQEQKSGTTIRQGEVVLALPQPHIQYTDWRFDPIADSAGKNYVVTMTGFPDQGGIMFFTVAPARSDALAFYLNGQEQADSRLILDWRYYTDHPIKTMLQRLVYAKPGIFNHQITFITLFIILEILAVFLLWFIINYFFFQNEKS